MHVEENKLIKGMFIDRWKGIVMSLNLRSRAGAHLVSVDGKRVFHVLPVAVTCDWLNAHT